MSLASVCLLRIMISILDNACWQKDNSVSSTVQHKQESHRRPRKANQYAIYEIAPSNLWVGLTWKECRPIVWWSNDDWNSCYWDNRFILEKVLRNFERISMIEMARCWKSLISKTKRCSCVSQVYSSLIDNRCIEILARSCHCPSQATQELS